ncbi:MAG TPA: DegT/DnrJ/EryC1/StrS family aminotransferase [Terriglobia bacterium]|nr:DegT/DnrJ/EryC1/StrS family aminotransferase [Terriglobia bacterium]
MQKKTLSRREFLGKTSISLAAAGAVPRSFAVSGNPNRLAVQGGTPVRSAPFPDWPQTTEVDEQNILKSLRNHRWCTMDGEFIPKFEKAWAREVGTRGCVMTPCGTHALQMALELLGVGPGDEVILSPYTYIATVDAVMMGYSLPVFADSDPKTFQIDPDDIEHRITEHTRAIMPVHIYGAPSHLDKVLAIGEKHNIPVIEDACQAHHAEWKGKKVGGLGRMGCFSFQETKCLPGGEAGALVSDDEELIEKAYMFRNFGGDPKTHQYAIRGFKYRISDFAAAVLIGQLERYEQLCAKREAHAAYLIAELKKIPGYMVQENYPESTRQNHYCFGVRCDPDHFNGLRQEKVANALAAEGILAGGGYSPLNKEPFIERSLNSRGFRAAFSRERLEMYLRENHLPKNDQLCATAFYLEQNVLLGEKSDVDDILEAFDKVQKNASVLS